MIPFCTNCQRDLAQEEVFEGEIHIECGSPVKNVLEPQQVEPASVGYLLGFCAVVVLALFAWLYLLQPPVTHWVVR